MVKKQEYTWREAQDDLEGVAIPWAQDHASRPDNDIDVLYPNLQLYTFQNADEVVTWAAELPGMVPDKVITTRMTYVLARGLGGNALRGWPLARQISENLKSQAAFADQPNGPRIAEQIQDDMRHGKNIVEAAPHQILADLGVEILSTLKAVGDLSYIKKHNFMPLSPTMKFEKFRGKPIPELSNPITTQVWVFPQTPSAAQRDIPRRLRARMGRKTSELIGPILDDPTRGTIFYNALMGSNMIPTFDPKTGQHTALDFPEVYDSAAGALDKADRTLPFAVYKNPVTGLISWDIGHFINREELDVGSEVERNIIYMDVVMHDLAERMRKLAKVPVSYTRPERAAELLGPAAPIVNSR